MANSFSLLLYLVLFSSIAFSQNKNDQATAIKSEKNHDDADCKHDKETFRCVKFLKNYDADTITVKIPEVHALFGEKISVRVRGIDAPEIKGKNPCEKDAARTARRLVESLLKQAKRIDLKNVDRDKYFRILADVEFDGKSLKEILLKNNLAYEYDGGRKKEMSWCKEKGSN
jgi:endonuclease YncB( thermonuclease family)